MPWQKEKYTADTKLHLRKKNEKNIGKNIWTGEEYQKTFDGNFFTDGFITGA